MEETASFASVKYQAGANMKENIALLPANLNRYIAPFSLLSPIRYILLFFRLQGVDFNLTNQNGETARSLALMNGHMKIIGLIDSCGMSPSSLRSEAG